MISIPWTIYHQNMRAQYTDQWEFIIYDDEVSFNGRRTDDFGARLSAYVNPATTALEDVRITRVDGALALPQTRITKLSFPMPFPEFKTKDLPNRVNVYDSAEFDTRDVTLSFTETNTFIGFRYFHEWFSKVYDIEKKQFKPNAETVYKYGCVVFKKKGLMSLGLIDKTSIRFNLIRLKLTGFDKNLDLDYSDGKPLEFTATMKVENVTYDFD